MLVLIRISDDQRWACVFNKETGMAEVMSAVRWQFMNARA